MLIRSGLPKPVSFLFGAFTGWQEMTDFFSVSSVYRPLRSARRLQNHSPYFLDGRWKYAPSNGTHCQCAAWHSCLFQACLRISPNLSRSQTTLPAIAQLRVRRCEEEDLQAMAGFR